MGELMHIDQRALDLLNGEVDGELNPMEQKELGEILAGSEDVRDFRKELKTFSRLLEDLPDLDPPQHLQESIERQVRLPVLSEEKKQGLFSSMFSANWLRTGFALAAGVLLTVSIYEMGSEPISDLDETRLVGTVIKNQVYDQGELLDRIDISNDTLNGFAELRKTADLFTLDVRVSSDVPTKVVLDFAARGLAFEGITRLNDSNETVTVDDGAISVAGSGEQQYILKLRSNTQTPGQQIAPLELEIFTNNSLVQEAKLKVSRQ